MASLPTTLNRRSFLKASAAAGGGLLLGFHWAGCRPSAPAPKGPPEAWHDLNAYLKVGDNGLVTIYSPNPEIGQNVKTSMPMIVAEELDVAWEDVVVEQAGLDTGRYQRQLAGGSQSIRHGWRGLRTAGATARRMLMEAAAQQWDVPLAELTTAAGVITHAPTGRTLGYGDVASVAAARPVPDDVPLKDPRDFTLVGTSRKNVDAKKIVTGQPLYGLDLQREGMLVAMIVHPPAFGMRPGAVDAAAARAMPGIRDVVTIDAAPEGVDRQWSDVNAFPQLVAVVGETTWQVLQAKQAVAVTWETVSPPESSADHDAALERALREGTPQQVRRDGDPEAAFARAAQVIERTYSAPFLAHNTMEPMTFFADVRADGAELVGPIQTPEFLRMSLSALLELPEDAIDVQMTRMGGGFGRRLYGNFGVEAALVSQAVGAPVKLVYTREDDMTQGTYRPAYRVRFRAALDEGGRMTAFHVRGAGIHGGPVFPDRYPAGTVDHYLAENVGVDSNVSTGAWRAPRSNFIAGAEQAFLDEVAEAAGQDPVAFRLALFDRAMTDPVGTDNDYDPARYAGVLELVRDRSGWDAPAPDGVARGVAAYYSHNTYVAEVVDVTLRDGQPRVDKVWCAVDCGIVVNPDAARNQVEGGIIDGLSHALYSALTLKDGRPEQTNFHAYRLMRLAEAPRDIEVHFVDNGLDPTGLGEPSLPPVSGALANALARATGARLYDQPFADHLASRGLRPAAG